VDSGSLPSGPRLFGRDEQGEACRLLLGYSGAKLSLSRSEDFIGGADFARFSPLLLRCCWEGWDPILPEGNELQEPDRDKRRFGGTPVAEFKVVSGKEI
jgi:hypothetical protein